MEDGGEPGGVAAGRRHELLQESWCLTDEEEGEGGGVCRREREETAV